MVFFFPQRAHRIYAACSMSCVAQLFSDGRLKWLIVSCICLHVDFMLHMHTHASHAANAHNECSTRSGTEAELKQVRFSSFLVEAAKEILLPTAKFVGWPDLFSGYCIAQGIGVPTAQSARCTDGFKFEIAKGIGHHSNKLAGWTVVFDCFCCLLKRPARVSEMWPEECK